MELFLTIIFIFTSLLYLPLNRRKSRYSFKRDFDKRIPVIQIFIIPYILFFIYVGLAFLLLWKKDAYLPFIQAMIIMSLINTIVWYFFPNGVHRPKIKDDNLLLKMLGLFYQHDKDTNGFPSAHVSYTLLASFFLWSVLPASLVLICAILISVSTVFVKQHYVIDIFGGILSFLATIGILAMIISM